MDNSEDSEFFDQEEQQKLNWQQIFLQERMMGEPQSIPQSVIYELINETINKEAFSIGLPKTEKITDYIKYIIFMPLTWTQYFTIPSPLSKRNDNYYPLTMVCSTIWIIAYTFVIVWFTYDVTEGCLDNRFSLIPMFLYPFGVTFRDIKKVSDFQDALKVFKTELPDQEISLAETYSPQIFQMTGLAGIAWLLYTMATSEQVKFANESIQYQLPILIVVVLSKLTILGINRFKTHKKMFKANCYAYIGFIVIVTILDYKDSIAGLTAGPKA